MHYRIALIVALGFLLASLTADANEPTLSVLVEEDVYAVPEANNGAGATWCYGSTVIARIDSEVFLTELEVVPTAQPLNNCQWNLSVRRANGWQRLHADRPNRTREPSPIAVFPDSREIFVSANPTLVADPEKYSGPARPQVVRFHDSNHTFEPTTLLPRWNGEPPFTEHSYRSFAADGFRRELILFQNIGYTHTEWAFRDRSGNWSATGKLDWQWGADYAKPQPIRICYPTVALVDQKVFFCGVSDIIEPNPQWAEFKKELTGRAWDYDFRRLFFTWTDDITKGEFHPWIEISSREETCGWIMPNDLYVDPEGAVHLLWSERAIDTRLREKFFPEAKQSEALCYALVREGKVLKRSDVMIRHENEGKPVAQTGRFHVTPDNRLWVVCYIRGREGEHTVSENRIVEIKNGAPAGVFRTIPLEKPFSSFFTATIRAGNKPSAILDLHGTSPNSNSLRYAAIKLD